MLRDYEYLFSTALRSKLKEKIKGSVRVEVDQEYDILNVTIKCNSIVWKKEFWGFTNKIHNGWSTDIAAYELVKEFKSYVMHRFFE